MRIFTYSFYFCKGTKSCPLGWGPGPEDVGQKSLNLHLIWRHLQKISNPKLPNFIVETRRLSETFEGLNHSLAQSAGELWHFPKLPSLQGMASEQTDSSLYSRYTAARKFTTLPVKKSKLQSCEIFEYILYSSYWQSNKVFWANIRRLKGKVTY